MRLTLLSFALWTAASALSAQITTPSVAASVTTPGIFSGGVAFDPVTAETWVVDGYSTVVGRYDDAGTPLSAFLAPVPPGAAVARPVGGTLDVRTGNLWIADESRQVFEVDAAGNVLRSWSVAPRLGHPSAIAIDPIQRVLFISDDRSNLIQQFDFSGAPIGPAVDVRLTAGSVDGDALVCNWLTRTLLLGEDSADRILEIDSSGTLIATHSLTGIPDLANGGAPITVSPEGLSLDTATGEVLVADSVGSTVHRVIGIIAAPTGSLTPFGRGCPDSGGTVPQLNMNGVIQGGAAYDFVVQTSEAPGAMAVFVIGTIPTSINLGFIGQPGCTLLAGPEVGDSGLLPVNANGRAGAGLTLGVALTGLTLRWQALVVPPGGLGAGLAASNGLLTTIQ